MDAEQLPKLTAKQEAFAQQIVKGATAVAAYRLAYDCSGMVPSTIYSNASRLLANSKVAALVTTAKARTISKSVLTTENIIEELEEARKMALRLEQPQAVVAASMAKAKVAGLVIDRKEIGAPGDFSRLQDTEIERMIAEQLQSLSIDAEPGSYQEIEDQEPEQSDIEDAIANVATPEDEQQAP